MSGGAYMAEGEKRERHSENGGEHIYNILWTGAVLATIYGGGPVFSKFCSFR